MEKLSVYQVGINGAMGDGYIADTPDGDIAAPGWYYLIDGDAYGEGPYDTKGMAMAAGYRFLADEAESDEAREWDIILINNPISITYDGAYGFTIPSLGDVKIGGFNDGAAALDSAYRYLKSQVN